jgi:hypothetical protein
LSTGQLIVTIACVGLLAALHLVLRAARAPAGTGAVAAPRTMVGRDPFLALLALAAFAALVVAAIAFVVSVADDEDEGAAPTARTATTAPTTTAAPPPSPPPPAPLETPSGTALIARVITRPDGSVASARTRIGKPVTVAEQEPGIYAVTVPGVSPQLRKRAVVRVRPADGAPGTTVSARKVGPQSDFVVFTRDAQSGTFVESGFELAIYLPKQVLERTAGAAESGRPKLPPTR